MTAIDPAFSATLDTALAAGRKAPVATRTSDAARARQVAEDFEAFYLAQVLQPMFSGLDPAPPFGGGHAEQIWQSQQIDEYGKAIARQGGVGLADTIMRHILQVQEAAS